MQMCIGPGSKAYRLHLGMYALGQFWPPTDSANICNSFGPVTATLIVPAVCQTVPVQYRLPIQAHHGHLHLHLHLHLPLRCLPPMEYSHTVGKCRWGSHQMSVAGQRKKIVLYIGTHVRVKLKQAIT